MVEQRAKSNSQINFQSREISKQIETETESDLNYFGKPRIKKKRKKILEYSSDSDYGLD